MAGDTTTSKITDLLARLAEVERRLADVEGGAATLKSWNTARDRIAARLRAKRT